MERKKHHLKERVTYMHNTYVYILSVLLCLTCILIPLQSKTMLIKIPTERLVCAFGSSILSSGLTSKTIYRHSLYDFFTNCILPIRSSDIMSKKYAALYGGITKQKDSTKRDETLLGNVLEADVSAKKISFINTPGYSVDVNSLLHTKLAFSSPYNGPRVLIVHTHTSEAYAENPDGRSEDNRQNVVCVGEELAKAIKKEGIEVIHDKTQNDNPSYNQSYKKAMTVIQKNLEKYPTIEVVLDIHRDYIKRDDGTMTKPTVTTKTGKKAAQIMFVIGTDNMGLYHPTWQHNLAFATQIQNELNAIQPGLCRPINIRTERFNQHATKGSMIIEVGTAVNTSEEAKLSGKLAGEAIAKVLLKY